MLSRNAAQEIILKLKYCTQQAVKEMKIKAISHLVDITRFTMNETPSCHWDGVSLSLKPFFALAFFSPLAKRLSPQPGSNAYKTLNLRRNWYTKPMWRRIGSPNEMFSPSISALNAQLPMPSHRCVLPQRP